MTLEWHGWQICAQHRPILKTSWTSTAEYSNAVWKTELGLTRFVNQELPVVYGGNALQLHHEPSGVRISFCALEALRSWAYLDLPPVPHLAHTDTPCEWDYTFTTPYAGSIQVAPLGCQVPARPNGTSIIKRSGVNLASGRAKLRPPICKCKVVRALLPGSDQSDGEPNNADEKPNTTAPTPRWQPSSEALDIKSLVQNQPPLHYDSVDLWVDNQDPASYSSLNAQVYVGQQFWAVCLRCFVRVNGVMARVINTRYVCNLSLGAHVVLRERSWQEGDWVQMLGDDENTTSAAAKGYHDFGGQGAALACERLPHRWPVTRERMVLPASGKPREPPCTTGEVSIRGNLITTCSISGTLILALNETTVMAARGQTGAVLWERSVADVTGEIAAAAVSPCAADGGRLAVGGAHGGVLIWRLSTGEQLASFDVAPNLRAGKRLKSNKWVEQMAWSPDGHTIAAAAGREVATFSELSGQVCSTVRADGAVYALSFLQVGLAAVPCLAWGMYGGVSCRSAQSLIQLHELLEVTCAAVLCMSLSPDGTTLAVGCMDCRVRLFELSSGGSSSDSAKDWTGFRRPVKAVAWSVVGSWLAVASGPCLLVAKRDLIPGDAPILMTIPGRPASGACDIGAVAWGSSEQREGLLAATVKQTHVTYIYDVGASNDAVPRQAAPLMTIGPVQQPCASGQLHLIFLPSSTASPEQLVIYCGTTVRIVSLPVLELMSAEGASDWQAFAATSFESPSDDGSSDDSNSDDVGVGWEEVD